MPEMSIGRAVSWMAAQAPDAVCVRVGEETLTRRELDTVTDRVARRWVRDGLGVDDVVAVSLPSGIDFVLACVAAWKAGSTPLPLRLVGDELAQVLALAGPALVVDEAVDRCEDDAGGDLPDRAASAWKLSASSGSTGPPKLIRAGAAARVDPAGKVAAFVPERAVQLVSGPMAHAAPFVYAMRGLMTGHELVVLPDFDGEEWLRLVERHRVTWAPLVPSTMQQIWRAPGRTAYDVGSLESVLHLGARCPEELKRAWLGWLGADRVVEVYAGSESQGVACIGGRDWLEHPGSVGRGVGGTEFRVLGADGSDCAPGELGEIVMRRPGPAYSYVGADPIVRDGWHTLGDAGWLDDDGWLFVGDRLDDLVRTPLGVVQPADVEAVLDAHPGVRSSAVVGLTDGAAQRVHAVVEAGVPVGELEEWVATRLRPEQRPTSWRLVDEPVRDDAGKVRRSRWRPDGRAGG